MRQITKTLKDKEVLFVEVPKGAFDFWMSNAFDNIVIINYRIGKYGKHSMYLKGNWQYICEALTATEEEAARIVEKDMVANIPIYKNYELIDKSTDHFNLGTAKESLQSLIKSVGILTDNEYGEKPEEQRYYTMELEKIYKNDLTLWQASQSKVWEKVIILINK